MNQEEFEEYIRQVEPEGQENARTWGTAIGLQAVDGLKPSQYLLDAARRNIDGDITIDEVKTLLDTYYRSKATRTAESDKEEEADRASVNIKKILSVKTIAFNTNGFIAVHRRIFEGVFKHAGQLRKYDITKKEWVLKGDSVNYLNWEDLRQAIDFDIQQERDFNYKGLTNDEKVKHISRFVSGLWQIHPFMEGNTRTTAVFTIQYLRSIGYAVNNDMFEKYSWYFRNALVRANYRNSSRGIDYDFGFLERFFQNLLFGANNVLKNRSMLIDAPDNWMSTDDKPTITDDKPTITDDKSDATDDKPTIILRFLREKGECKTSDISDFLGLKPTQTKAYLSKLVKAGKIIAHGANRNRTYTLA